MPITIVLAYVKTVAGRLIVLCRMVKGLNIKPNELVNCKFVDGSQNIEGCLKAIDVVLDVMKAQIGNPDVCKNGCRTLGFIALKNGK